MADSSDEERFVAVGSSEDDSDADELLSAPSRLGKRITKKPQHFEAGPASRSAVSGEAKCSPGGTKQTDPYELLREKQRRDRIVSKKKLEMDREYGEEGADMEHLTDTTMAKHRQLVDGWSDDEDSDDEMPCAFARWDASTWADLPHCVPPIDRKVARSDAVACGFREAHKHGVASEIRLLLATYKPQLSGSKHPTQPTIMSWLLGLTACSFDEGLANQAFELLSLSLAKADSVDSGGVRWPKLSLLAEYINLYGTTSPLPTQTAELRAQRYRSESRSTSGAAMTAAGAAAANPPPALSPARKRRKREIEVPGVGDIVKVAFNGQGGGKEQYFDGEVKQTAAEGTIPTGTTVYNCKGSPLGPRDFIVYFSSDEEYWRLDAKQQKNFKIKRRAAKKSRQSQLHPHAASGQPDGASQGEDTGSATGEDQGESCIAIEGEQMFPVANLRLLLMLAAEIVRRSGYSATERSTALALSGLCAMVAADPTTSHAWLAARSLLAALIDASFITPCLAAPSENGQESEASPAIPSICSTVQVLTEAMVAAIVPAALEPPPTAATEAAVSTSTETAWRERHSAEVLWSLPPTVGGAVVRMHTTVWFLTDALKALMNDPPPPVEVQGSDSAASTIDATASVATEDMKAACASGRTAMQAAARLAEVVVSACDHSAGVAKNSAATRLDSAEKLEAVYESLQELLSIICRLLDATKQKLGAVQAMRDEQWALNQLRLVEGLAESAELIAVHFDLRRQNPVTATDSSEPSLSQQEYQGAELRFSWRDDLGGCIDGWQKSMKYANGQNWTGVQAWFVTWKTRSNE